MARAFGLQVVGFSRAASVDEMRMAGIVPAASLDGLLAMADIISLHAVGGSPAMIGAREFSLMKPGAMRACYRRNLWWPTIHLSHWMSTMQGAS